MRRGNDGVPHSNDEGVAEGYAALDFEIPRDDDSDCSDSECSETAGCVGTLEDIELDL